MRERLLIGGDAKSGKTHTALDIISNDAGCKCRYIECDDGIRRLLELQFTHLLCPVCKGRRADSDGVICIACKGKGTDIKRLDVETVHTWPEIKTVCSSIVADVASHKLGPKDWVVIDGIDIMHSLQRYEFVKRVYEGTTDKKGNALGSTWDAIISKRRGGGPVLEPSDWDPIYMEFESAFNPIIFGSTTNVLATCGVSPIKSGSQYEDTAQVEFYRALGMQVKYDGYKRVPRVFDTLITLGFDPNGHYFTVWGDRGSRGMKGHPVGQRIKMSRGMFWDYLVGMAGYGG